jgi:hypothetical protein
VEIGFRKSWSGSPSSPNPEVTGSNPVPTHCNKTRLPLLSACVGVWGLGGNCVSG